MCVIVGVFAVQLAFGQGGQASGTRDVFQTIANQPFGQFLLAIMAQGVVLIMIGSFFAQAAIQYQPSEARGLGGAFRTLAEQPYGPWLLAIVALGLIAHGIYNFGLARYRRIQTS